MPDGCFYYWCDQTASTSSSAVTVWNGWASGSTTVVSSSANSAAVTWLSWLSVGTTSGSAVTWNGGEPFVQRTVARTAEQVAADDAQWAAERAEIGRRARDAAIQRRDACERAKRLLDSMLECHQRTQLQREHFFEVVAQHSRRRYRIRHGTHGNVFLLDAKGRQVTRYCGQPNGVPTEDAMLAQKLQIEYDEDAFLKAANASRA